MIVLDVMKPLTHRKKIEYELHGFGIRLNQKPPQIIVKRKDKGGVSIVKRAGVEMNNMTEDVAKSIAHEYRISNADIIFGEDATVD
jgi:ribosome-interacting GTPase 1